MRLIALALTLSMVGFVSAQQSTPQPQKAVGQQCTLTVEQAPELRGLKLGMAYEQAQKMYPDKHVWMRADEFGKTSDRLAPSESQGSGTYRIDVEFLDDKLTSIEVYYENSVKFKDARDFAKRVLAGLKLPGEAREDRVRDEHSLDCVDFRVLISYNHGIVPIVRLFQPSADETIKKRQAENEKKKLDEFKP